MTKDEALHLALEAMNLANSSHDTMLLSDPPQSAWRYHNVDMKLREAIIAIKATLEANEFNPDWDTQSVMVEEIQRMAKRIEELEHMSADKLALELLDVVMKYNGTLQVSTVVGVLEMLKLDIVNNEFKTVLNEMRDEAKLRRKTDDPH